MIHHFTFIHVARPYTIDYTLIDCPRATNVTYSVPITTNFD